MQVRSEKDLWVEMSIEEIKTQADFAEIAFLNLDPKAAAGTRVTFSSIHSFLSHSAMISKMLVSKDDAVPSKTIGDVLGVQANALIHQRVFRNHLEHYDERLKKWITKHGPNVNIGVNNIGAKSALSSIPNMVYVSHYDPATKHFTFVNDDFDLAALFTETQRISALAQNWIEQKRAGKIVPPFI